MSFCTSLRNFIQTGPPSAQKNWPRRFLRWRISAILDFMGPIMGSWKTPCTTSYRSLIDTIALNCLVFEKIAFLYFGDRQTNERTDGQARCMKPLSPAAAVAVISGGLTRLEKACQPRQVCCWFKSKKNRKKIYKHNFENLFQFCAYWHIERVLSFVSIREKLDDQ